ncbi:hypothetical protein P0082_02875 [Candidatus Haliotispira prima]|uniref:Uncharacterized protein n=1 Tax=Candidatus Haliotispira prima TaxID=3034016 RepID=A0ABY8MJ23_9SPIO|nr:hypothetical protein P0082_02875 [Candidatus Haliotispira prima]
MEFGSGIRLSTVKAALPVAVDQTSPGWYGANEPYRFCLLSGTTLILCEIGIVRKIIVRYTHAACDSSPHHFVAIVEKSDVVKCNAVKLGDESFPAGQQST